jgi:hypothetical protein
MPGAKKGSRQTCGYCGITGHQARTCHVALEGREPDEYDRAAFELLDGSRNRDIADDRRRVADYLRSLAEAT